MTLLTITPNAPLRDFVFSVPTLDSAGLEVLVPKETTLLPMEEGAQAGGYFGKLGER